MIGNISKSKGFKGDAGSPGPQGPPGPKGVDGTVSFNELSDEQRASLKGADGLTPSIKFIYDEDTGNLSYTSDGILVDTDYIDTNNLATKDFVTEKILEVANKVASSPASITLYADRWEQVGEDAMWYQEVVVANATITEYSKVDLQLSAEQLLIFYEKDLTFVTENDGGTITVYCIGQKPANTYVIQATVSEVKIDGE